MGGIDAQMLPFALQFFPLCGGGGFLLIETVYFSFFGGDLPAYLEESGFFGFQFPGQG